MARNNYHDVEIYNGYIISENLNERNSFRIREVGTLDNSANRAWMHFYGREYARETIDEIKGGKRPFISEKERHEKVTLVNQKNGWGMSKVGLKNLLRKFMEGDLKERTLIIDRLEDINYHKFVRALDKQDYVEYQKLLEEM